MALGAAFFLLTRGFGAFGFDALGFDVLGLAARAGLVALMALAGLATGFFFFRGTGAAFAVAFAPGLTDFAVLGRATDLAALRAVGFFFGAAMAVYSLVGFAGAWPSRIAVAEAGSNELHRNIQAGGALSTSALASPREIRCCWNCRAATLCNAWKE